MLVVLMAEWTYRALAVAMLVVLAVAPC